MRRPTVAARPGQEARAHPVGDIAEPQVEARRLDLVGGELARGNDGAAGVQRRDHAVGQDALVVCGKGKATVAAQISLEYSAPI